MSIKNLQTRLALKYDNYQNWNKWYLASSPDTALTQAPDTKAAGFDINLYANKGAALKLLPGEVAFCHIPNTDPANKQATTAPTVLFKVGDGNLRFYELNWASAKAADVYQWAKASDVTLDGKTIKFVGTDKTLALNYATPEEVAALVNPLSARVADVENEIGGADGNGGLKAAVAALDERLDAIDGTSGAIAAALAEAKAYADQAEADALANAKTYADGKASANKALIDENAADILEISGGLTTANQNIQKNADDISDLDTAYKAADSAINAKIGGSYSNTATVHAAIVDAKKAGTDAAAAVEALENGAVKTNADNIAENAAAIAQAAGDITALDTAYKAADQALDTRLAKVETFFEGAAEDGKNNVEKALDTLVEIQNFIDTDGTTAQAMVEDINANTAAVTYLKSVVDLAQGSSLGGKLEALENSINDNTGAISDNKSDIEDLQAITNGYSGNNAIKTAVDAAAEAAEAAAGAAAAAQDAADAAQGDATAAKNLANSLNTTVNDSTNGLVKKVGDNAGAIASLQELTKNYGDVTSTVNTLKTTVIDGDDANAKLRSAITTLQNTVGHASHGNTALYTGLQAVTTTVGDANSGLVKTVNEHSGRIAAIENDYLKAADQLVFRCGDSITNVFTA